MGQLASTRPWKNHGGKSNTTTLEFPTLLSTFKTRPKVNKDYISHVCPICDAHTGKKELSDRIHSCKTCGYTTHRDVASAQVIRNRGVLAVGRIVGEEIACGDGLTGTGNSLVTAVSGVMRYSNSN